MVLLASCIPYSWYFMYLNMPQLVFRQKLFLSDELLWLNEYMSKMVVVWSEIENAHIIALVSIQTG